MPPKRTRTQMLAEFMEGINTMEGAATQLVSTRANPKWMALRDMLHIIKGSIDPKIVIGAERP